MNQLPYIASAVLIGGGSQPLESTPCQVYGVFFPGNSGTITDGSSGGNLLFALSGGAAGLYLFDIPLKFEIGPHINGGGNWVLYLGPTP